MSGDDLYFTLAAHSILFNEPATTEIYTLSLHDALPISRTEGILLDPVYTARAFYGMLDYLNLKKIKPN